MGSTLHSATRLVEAGARIAAMQTIGYRGRLDADGYPIDGRARSSTRRQPFRSPVRSEWERLDLSIDAAEDACYGGGAQLSAMPALEEDA